MTGKPQQIAGYSTRQTELAVSMLLEVWSRLGDFHPHLVLVGGMAPRFLVPQDRAPGAAIPLHCGTMDVDLAVSLAVANLQTYAGIRDTLTGSAGFEPGVNRIGNPQRHSFTKQVSGANLVLDFLTTSYDGPDEKIRQIEENLSAIQVEGLGLAFIDPLEIPVQGELLDGGGIVDATLRVCRPVPFVVLKALALAKRGEPKDAYDLVYVLRYVAGGPSALARSVTPGERKEPSFTEAIDVLKTKFSTQGHDGPMKYGRFLGAPAAGENVQAFAAVQEFLQALNATQE